MSPCAPYDRVVGVDTGPSPKTGLKETKRPGFNPALKHILQTEQTKSLSNAAPQIYTHEPHTVSLLRFCIVNTPLDYPIRCPPLVTSTGDNTRRSCYSSRWFFLGGGHQ